MDDIEGTENPHDYDPADVPDTEAAARESPTFTEPKRKKITKEFIDKCGQTPGCIKCAHIELGRKSTAAHSDECRQRISHDSGAWRTRTGLALSANERPEQPLLPLPGQ